MSDQTNENSDNLPALQVDAIIEVDKKASSKRVLPPDLYAKNARLVQTKDITIEMIDEFLDQLTKTGRFEISARRIGLNARTMQKIRKMDCEFNAMCEAAIELYVDNMFVEGHRRGFEGWEEPIYSHKSGKLLGMLKKYDGKLAELYLKRHDPAFRDGAQAGGGTSGLVIVVPMVPATKEAWVEQASRPVESRVVDDGTPSPAQIANVPSITQGKQ